MAINTVTSRNSPNTIVITDRDQNQITVTQPVTSTLEVSTPGPRGPVGPQGETGPSGSLQPSNSGSFEITGSLLISGSGTFTNIGPAIFSGSVESTQGFTGSFKGDGAGLYDIPASAITGLNLSQIATGSISASVGLGIESFQIISGSSNFLTVLNSGKVGVGTTSPTRKFEVQAVNDDLQIVFGRTGSFEGTGAIGANSLYALMLSRGVGYPWPLLVSRTNGRVSLNTYSDLGAQLGVKGSGTTSATTALLVQNANASASLTITDDSNVLIQSYYGFTTGSAFEIKGNTGDQSIFKILSNGTATLGWNGGTTYPLTIYGNSGLQFQVGNGQLYINPVIIPIRRNIGTPVNFTYVNQGSSTNNDNYTFLVGENIATAGSNAEFTAVRIGPNMELQTGAIGNQLRINPVYNLASGANGTVRGIYYNPTITNLQSATHIALQTTSGDVKIQGNANVEITGSLDVSGSAQFTDGITISGSTTINGNVTIHGTASVDVLITNYESSSIIYSSGSTKFGDSMDDTHEFTGSLYVTGSLNILDTVPTITLTDSGTSGGLINFNVNNAKINWQSGGFQIRYQNSTRLDLSNDTTEGLKAWALTAGNVSRNNGGNALTVASNTANGRAIIGADEPTTSTYRTAEARLHVRGEGTTSSTTALLVQNANASASLTITDDNVITAYEKFTISRTSVAPSTRVFELFRDGSSLISMYANGTFNASVVDTDLIYVPTIDPQSSGGAIYLKGGSNSYGEAYVGNVGIGRTQTTADATGFGIYSTFSPSNTSYNNYGLKIQPTLTQPIGSTGTLYGIYYAPTLTSLSGSHIAIETTAGDVKFGGNANVEISGSSRFYSEQDSAFIATVSGSRSVGDTAFTFSKIGETGGNRHLMNLSYNYGTDNSKIFSISTPSSTWFSAKGNGSLNINMPLSQGNYGGVAIGGWLSSYPSLLVRGIGTTSSTTALLVENSNASASLSVLDNGYVGIGTASPGKTLDITGEIRTSGRATFNEYVNTSFIYGNTDLVLAYAGGTTGIIIKSDGKVGIGMNDSPTSRLHVKGSGTTNATTAFRVENANASASLQVKDDGYVEITNSNNINIPFQVQRQNKKVYTDFSSGINALTLETDTAFGNRLTFYNTAYGSTYHIGQVYYANRLAVYDNSYTELTSWDLANMRVGIGTTTPSEKLEVSGSIRATEIKINTGSRFLKFSGTTLFLLASNESSVTSGATDVVVGRLGLGSTYSTIDIGGLSKSSTGYLSAIWATSGKDALRVYDTSSLQVLTITENGKLGIGATTPSYKLHVSSSNNNDGIAIHYPSTNATQFPFYVGDNSNGVYARLNSTDFEFKRNGAASTIKTVGSNNDLVLESATNLVFNTGGANERMRISNGGNVGIGTTTPSSSLHVSGSTTIDGVLTLTPQDPLPTGVPTGSFAVSSSVPPKPYFYDGTSWNALY